MKSLAELHTDHSELISEITFLKKEIEFFLKLLRNGYSISINMDKIKLLDGYWKGFEENSARLDSLLERINKEEKQLAGLYRESLIDEEKTLFKEDTIISDFYKTNKAVKVLKESFYEYMSDFCSYCVKSN